MRRPILAGCLLLALGSIASSQSGVPDDGLSPAEILSPAVQVPAGGANPAAKTEAKTDPAKKSEAMRNNNVDHLAQCLRDWDAATHMSRQEWARTCRRVVSNRTRFLSEQQGK